MILRNGSVNLDWEIRGLYNWQILV